MLQQVAAAPVRPVVVAVVPIVLILATPEHLEQPQPITAIMAVAVAAAGMAAALVSVLVPMLLQVAVAAMYGRHPQPHPLLRDTASLLPTISPMHKPSLVTLRSPHPVAARRLDIQATATPSSHLIIKGHVNLMP